MTTSTIRMPAVPKKIGNAAGVLAVSLLVFSGVGALWGLLRPAYTGTLGEGGQVTLDQSFNVEFTSYITFVAATGLLSIILALSVYIISPESRGPGMLWWLLFVAGFSALSFYFVGLWATSLVHPIPDPDTLAEGVIVSLVPSFSPGVGLAAAPFMAALTYWCCALVTPEYQDDSALLE
ncbi:hypothetical protein [Corynebacterium alimapuense]|uniref:DUF2567 domain-containing protein n=1 Tax=Corynebacterium alimapuense TaxID=1576874 RepID=A0A3M8K8A0_9CORY|nr:hypothetical protein [Corynebacterium alimapuense]RNE49457.1 hypothetical protein C5L39_03625 [Corynebacterium alimapuense]